MSVNFQAKGADEIIGYFDGLHDAIANRAVGVALRAGAEVILKAVQRNLKENVKERTGKLAGAIRIGRRKKSGAGAKIEIGVFKGEAPHAHLVEFGHGGPHAAAPKPFLRPGYEQAKDDMLEAVGEAIVDAALRRTGI